MQGIDLAKAVVQFSSKTFPNKSITGRRINELASLNPSFNRSDTGSILIFPFRWTSVGYLRTSVARFDLIVLMKWKTFLFLIVKLSNSCLILVKIRSLSNQFLSIFKDTFQRYFLNTYVCISNEYIILFAASNKNRK